jgi:microcystin degradation protein MlrC
MTGRKYRVAIGQISAESNHFVSSPCAIELFHKTGYVLEGDDLLGLKNTNTEIAGMLAVLENSGEVDIIPLLAARGISSGPLTEQCYTYLKDRLLFPLKDAGRVDGVILSHHGSMAIVNDDDPEGDIASAVREIVGPTIPIVMTLDLHSNVTRRMVTAVNAILSYEHYPHDDVFETGARGARLLMKTMRREARPVVGHAKLPLLLTAFNASTTLDTPYKRLMTDAKLLEQEPGILSASVLFVGSYIDMADMGCSALVVTDGDAARAVREAKALAKKFWDQRHAFVVEIMSVEEAVKVGKKIQGGPVLLLDTSDTTGGGAAGDGVGVVAGLLGAGVTERCLAMVIDPEAAKACHEAGQGSELTLQLGHKIDPTWGAPITLTGRVARLSDGRFKYEGGPWGGKWVTMGPSAILTVGNIQILIMTYPTYDWADEQYRSVGLDPECAKFVGVKNMMNFRFGYRNIMKGFFVLDLPGPTPPDMRMLTFKRATRPLFPLDEYPGVPDIRISESRLI